MPKSVLVCAAHPDDEVFGCGGTIARHVAEGDTVSILFFTDGGRPRFNAARLAAEILGAPEPLFSGRPCGLEDQKLDAVPLVKLIGLIEHLTPNIIYTHHLGDLNLDHRLVAQAVLTAFRPLPGSTVEAIYGFEVLSSTEWGLGPFAPTRLVAIDLKKKIAALREYDSEMRAPPHPRCYGAVTALALLRGATAGVTAAEAFTVLREIVK